MHHLPSRHWLGVHALHTWLEESILSASSVVVWQCRRHHPPGAGAAGSLTLHESSIQHETCNFVMKIHYRVEFTEKRNKFRNEQQSDGELQIFAFRVTEHRLECLYKYWLEIFRKQPRSSKTASILQSSDRFEVSSKTRTCNVHPLCSSLKGSAPFIDWLNYRLSSRVTQSSCVSLAAAVRNGLRRQPMCNPF